MRLLAALIFAFSFLIANPSHSAVWNITYPKNINHDTLHNKYAIALLDLALAKTGVRYQLHVTEDVLTQQRSIQLLNDKRRINVMWSMTDIERENLLLPIRIPIYKGLIGWRVFLHHEVNQTLWQNLDADVLRDKTVVQGLNWPDNKILRSNGFNVVNATDHIEAFQLTRQQQVDFFPRSVIEVLDELANDDLSEGLVVEPNFVLQYPTAVYFFVNSGDIILHKLIEQGLNAAVEDGSMDALFNQTYASMLEEVGLRDRIKIPLDNPLLPKNTAVGDIKLWYLQ